MALQKKREKKRDNKVSERKKKKKKQKKKRKKKRKRKKKSGGHKRKHYSEYWRQVLGICCINNKNKTPQITKNIVCVWLKQFKTHKRFQGTLFND